MINGHGGNIYKLAESLGCRPANIVDMSSNVNPLGPMPELMAHLKENLEIINALPQVDAQSVRAAFAQRYEIDPQLVLAGNGSTQWIYTLPLALKARRALIVGPTYADYADACASHGIEVRYYKTVPDNGFSVDLSKISRMTTQADIVFICNPNNPTGRLIPVGALEELCRAKPDTIFVIDESYLPFVPQSDSHSLLKKELPNTIILTSMSKIFRLPGLRIGFIKSSRRLLLPLLNYCLPWAVNSLAAEAVLWLMQHRETVDRFVDDSQRFIEQERERFRQIEAVPGMICFDSCASFLLIRLPDHTSAEEIWEAMAKEKFLIRDCSNFHGLSSSYIRVSLKDTESNRKAAELLMKLCRR